MNIDTHIAAELGELAEHGFRSSDFFWRNYISWVERGRPSMLPEDMAEELRETEHMPPSELLITQLAPGVQREPEPVVSTIPIIGTIDSATGAITMHAPLPEPPAPPTEYAAGRMSFGAWIIGALGIAAAVAIAAAVVLVERVKGRREE